MKFKGTKGEWMLQSETPKKGKYEAEELMIDFSEIAINCVSVYCAKWSSDAENLANAKLIAAAPELLEALQELLENHVQLVSCGDCGHWDVETEEEVIKARKAIEKALK